MKLKTIVFISHNDFNSTYHAEIEYFVFPKNDELLVLTTGELDSENMTGYKVLVALPITILHIPNEEPIVYLNSSNTDLSKAPKELIQKSLDHAGFVPIQK